MLTQCVPVIIQPNVTQPFEPMLPYASFSLRLTKADIPTLPAILRAVPHESICAMQRALARYYRAILWQKPFGVEHAGAYDLTQVWLCQRARALAASYAASGKYPRAYLARRPLACADTLGAAGIHFR